MRTIKEKKMILDLGILALTCVFMVAVYLLQIPQVAFRICGIFSVCAGVTVVYDLMRLNRWETETESGETQKNRGLGARELVLLDEQERAVKSWSLTGKTAMVIGRYHKDEEVDVDLSDCEYAAMIDIQHALLNYCMDAWYLEDLDSHNGVKVRKVEDGAVYRLTGSRPCRIMPGDIIYIANTRLLLT